MCAGRHSIAHSLSVPLCPSHVGEEEDRTGGSSVPSLDIANASQQIDVARRVLLHNVFYVVGFEGLFELAPRYEVLDLIRRSLTWSVLVKDQRDMVGVCSSIGIPTHLPNEPDGYLMLVRQLDAPRFVVFVCGGDQESGRGVWSDHMIYT